MRRIARFVTLIARASRARGCCAALGGLSLAGCVSVGPVTPTDPTVAPFCTIARDAQPEGLSGITRIAGDRYYCVDDSGGRLYEVELAVDEATTGGTFRVLGCVTLEGRRDLEGCACDPLDGRVWVSDESDHSIRQFDPKTGRETAAVAVPEVFTANMRPGRSFEALTVSGDGLRMYAANEDTLACDGPVATRKRGGIVRLQEFVRTGRDAPWEASRQWFYPTDAVGGRPYDGLALSGVVALCETACGRLLVLEREMSKKNPLVPSFRARLYAVDLNGAGDVLRKRFLWGENTLFANYEGLCAGANLADGTPTLVLVSDGDGPAVETARVLTITSTEGEEKR